MELGDPRPVDASQRLSNGLASVNAGHSVGFRNIRLHLGHFVRVLCRNRVLALDAAVISFWSYRKGQPAYKILFNVCALPLTIWLASHLFFYLTQLNSDGRVTAGMPLFRNDDPVTISELLGPLFVFTVVYFSA